MPEETLLLREGQFRVGATWAAPNGQAGSVGFKKFSERAALLTFVEETPALLVAVVESQDGDAVQLGGSTNYQFIVTVTRVSDGKEWTYSNPLGKQFGVLDWGAFPRVA